jgi:LysM repeat protein
VETFAALSLGTVTHGVELALHLEVESIRLGSSVECSGAEGSGVCQSATPSAALDPRKICDATAKEEDHMGLFDFVRSVGHKLFDKDADANDKIKKEIEASLKGVDGLTVDYDPANGAVKLGGQAASAEVMEKAVLIAGNTLGVANVNVDALKAPAENAAVEYYIIKPGDTLSAIAQHFYKDANKYPQIFEANREVIKDANLIFPGQKIRIPPA